MEIESRFHGRTSHRHDALHRQDGDRERDRQIVALVNPHCLLRIDVTGEDGQVVEWIAETQAPNTIYLERLSREILQGWGRSDRHAAPGGQRPAIRPARASCAR